LRSKWDRWLLTRGHADDTSACDRGILYDPTTLLDILKRVKCAEGAAKA